MHDNHSRRDTRDERTVAQNAAAQSTLDAALLKRMLPMLAMLIAGFMAKQQGLVSMLDLNGDGNPLDDILHMVGRVAR